MLNLTTIAMTTPSNLTHIRKQGEPVIAPASPDAARYEIAYWNNFENMAWEAWETDFYPEAYAKFWEIVNSATAGDISMNDRTRQDDQQCIFAVIIREEEN